MNPFNLTRSKTSHSSSHSQLHEVTGCRPSTGAAESPEGRRLVETVWHTFAELLTEDPLPTTSIDSAIDSATGAFESGTVGSTDPKYSTDPIQIRRRLIGAWSYAELDYSAVKYFR